MVYRDGVTIAVLNEGHEMFLPRSIRSALRAVADLRAGGHDGEVLVVDDGSRDGSPSLLRNLEARYHDAGLRVHRNDRPVGPTSAWNAALRLARFRHIVPMHAADEILGANLPLFLQSIRATQAAAVYGNLMVRRLADPLRVILRNHESLQNKLLEEDYLEAFALFDRIQLLDVGGFGDAPPGDEEWELWLHLATHGRRIVFVPLAFGYRDELPSAPVAPALDPEARKARFRHRFDPGGTRQEVLMRSNHLRYFPGVGYL